MPRPPPPPLGAVNKMCVIVYRPMAGRAGRLAPLAVLIPPVGACRRGAARPALKQNRTLLLTFRSGGRRAAA